MNLRELQLECARALTCINASNTDLVKFNRMANHNSQIWYQAVVDWYISEYGGLPSKIGPGKDIKLVLDNV